MATRRAKIPDHGHEHGECEGALVETLTIRDIDGEEINVAVMAYHNNGNGPVRAPWDVFYVDRLVREGRRTQFAEFLGLEFPKRPSEKALEAALHKMRRAADRKDAAEIRRKTRRSNADGR